jgi:hypothetical protein
MHNPASGGFTMQNRMTEFGAKTVGKAKGVIAAVKGLSGVFNTLAQEHAEAGSLLKRAKASDSAETRAGLWAEIRVALLSHEKAELEVVYPVLAEYPDLKPFVVAHAKEATALEACIKEIDAINASSGTWKPKLEELIGMVTEHVEEEEKQWFPKAIELIGKDKAEELDPMFLSAQEAAKKAA